MKIELTALVSQRETTCLEEKESEGRPWIVFLVFCCSSNVLVHWFRLHSCMSGVRSISGVHRKIGVATSAVFGCLHILISGLQLTVFISSSPLLFSFPRQLLTVFPFESPSTNQNSLSIHCWYVSIFNTSVLNYFTIYPSSWSPIITFSFLLLLYLQKQTRKVSTMW